MKNKLHVGFDIDGVVSDTILDIVKKINIMNNTNYKITDVTDYALKSIGLTNSKKFFKEYELQYLGLPRMRNSKKILDAFSNKGYTITYITARNYPKAFDDLVGWLEIHKLPADNILVGQEGSKASICKKLNIDTFVDDNWNEIYNFHEIAPNTQAILYAAPWNKQHQDILPTVKNWVGIYNYITKMI